METDDKPNDPTTTEHEIVSAGPEVEARTDRDRDAGWILTTGPDSSSQSSGRMPARRGE